jgi:hypothetical protein
MKDPVVHRVLPACASPIDFVPRNASMTAGILRGNRGRHEAVAQLDYLHQAEYDLCRTSIQPRSPPPSAGAVDSNKAVERNNNRCDRTDLTPAIRIFASARQGTAMHHDIRSGNPSIGSKAKLRLMAMGLLLLCTLDVQAAALTNLLVTPASLTTGVTTNYQIQFRLASAASTSRAFRIEMQSGPANANPNFSGASLVSVSGGTLNISIGNAASTSVYFPISSGSASANTLVTITLSGIINPTATAGNAYRIRMDDSSSYNPVDEGIASGNTYVANSGPVVVSPIPNQNNVEVYNGTYAAVANLNTVFSDGNGDPMTFTVTNIANAAVASASVSGNTLNVTPTAHGSTDITVRATAVDGFIEDTFNVSVIGLISNVSVTPATLVAGSTTSYSITFRPHEVLNNGDFLILTTAAGGPNQSGSSVASISGGLTGTRTAGSAASTVIMLTGGTTNPSTTYTLVLNNIVNPGAAGTGPEYVLSSTDGGSTLDKGRSPGNLFTSANAPTVVTPIPDQQLRAENGETLVQANLNTNFTDGNGDPLSFSIQGNTSPAVATARVAGNQLFVTPLAFGTTTISVGATDNIDGSVQDAFDVRVQGLLTPAGLAPASLFTNTTTNFTATFTPRATLVVGDQILLHYPAGFDASTTTISSVSPNTATLNITSNASTLTVIRINSGSIASTTTTLQLSGIRTPSTVGNAGNYAINTQPSGDTPIYAWATIPGSTFVIDPDLIFRNGFDSVSSADTGAELGKAIPPSRDEQMQRPRYDPEKNSLIFFGEVIAATTAGRPLTGTEISDWLAAVLKRNDPAGDWDGDGTINALDDDVFGFSNSEGASAH